MDGSVTAMESSIVFCLEGNVGFVFVGSWIVEMLVLLEVWEEIFERPAFVAEFLPLFDVSAWEDFEWESGTGYPHRRSQ